MANISLNKHPMPEQDPYFAALISMRSPLAIRRKPQLTRRNVALTAEILYAEQVVLYL